MRILDDGTLEGVPCGCPACDNGIHPGHFACEVSPSALLAWEKNGEAVRAYNDRWEWVVTNRPLRNLLADDPDYIWRLSQTFDAAR